MASAIRLDPGRDFSPGSNWMQAGDVAMLLNAVCRLVSADGVHLVEVDGSSGRPDVRTAGWSTHGQCRPLPAEVVAAIASLADARYRSQAARWLELDEAGQACFVVPLAENKETSCHFVLAFDDPGTGKRGRVSKLATDLRTLVGAQLDLKAKLAEAERERSVMSHIFDDVGCGVVAVREDHSVAFVNKVAAGLLAAQDGLALRRGVVRSTDQRDAIRFHAALETAISASDRDAVARAPAPVMMLRCRNGPPMLTVLAPLRLAAGDDARSAAATIYMVQPEAGSARGLETLCSLFGLSRVETRLVAQLHVGHTVAQAAVEMRIKVETARAYLKQIFAKTGMHRQSDLVSLMSRYLPALHGNFDFHIV